MQYFSEMEVGQVPRNREDFSERAWKGIRAEIDRCVSSGSFGKKSPDVCPDGNLVTGTDPRAFEDALLAEVPGLAAHQQWSYVSGPLATLRDKPSTNHILDLIQFCWKNVAEPRSIGHHRFFGHNHLEFDEREGRRTFRNTIESIFRRNGLAYRLLENGTIERILPQALSGLAAGPDFDTGDGELDRLLITAQRKFLDPHPESRHEALEALWDAWERLKTLDGENKKKQIQLMLDTSAGGKSPTFRCALEKESRELTGIGNSLRIRHSETDQEMLTRPEHADYLFYRLFSLIHLILATGTKHEPIARI